MISESSAKQFCKDDINKIENYEQAINDKDNLWDCHHRLELTMDGEFAHTRNELKRFNMYYNRPYFELIFMKQNEHRRLHLTGRKLSEETKLKMSKSQKGKVVSNETKQKISLNMKGKQHSEFGKKFKEHYGITGYQNSRLYSTEYSWYFRHNKICRWENK